MSVYMEENDGCNLFYEDNGSTVWEECGIIFQRWPVRMSVDKYCDYCPHFGDPNTLHCMEGK